MTNICNTVHGQRVGSVRWLGVLRRTSLAIPVLLAAGLAAPVSGTAQSVTAINAETDGTSAEQDLLERANKATEALIAGRLDEALRLLNEVIGSNAMAPRVLAASHYHRGIIHQKQGRYNDDAADYTTALWLEEMPDNMRARAHYNRGTALDNLGQQERAKQDFDIAISLAPDMAAAYNNRANVLRRMGQNEAAIADYDKSIELGNPLPHLPLYGRAAAREALGDIEGARADLRRAVSLAPDYAPAGAALAALPPPPSALSVAAAPEPVTPGTGDIDIDAIAKGPGIAVEPVETAMLPPPPATSTAAAAPEPPHQDAPQQTAAAPDMRSPAVPRASESVPVASVPAPAPAGTQRPTRSLADLPPAQTQIVASAGAGDGVAGRRADFDEGAAEAMRITTASAAPAQSAPSAAPGKWTTTILPAGSREVLTLDDVTPDAGLALTTAALRTNTPTRVAAITPPEPKAGMSFPGVPAENFREPPGDTQVRTAAATPPPVPSSPAASIPAGQGFTVQIASFRSAADAEAAWAVARTRHAQALANRAHLIERADIPGKGIYYRLRVGPLAARSAASALCSTLKSQGQDCYVSKL